MVDKKEMYRLHLGVSSCSENDSEADMELDEIHKSNKPPALNYEAIQDKIVKVRAKSMPALNIWNQKAEERTRLSNVTSDPKVSSTKRKKKKKKKKSAKTKQVETDEPVKKEPEQLKFNIFDDKSFPPLTGKRGFQNTISVSNTFPSSISTKNKLLNDNEMFIDQRLEISPNYATKTSMHVDQNSSYSPSSLKNSAISHTNTQKKGVSKTYEEITENLTLCHPYSAHKIGCENIINTNSAYIQLQDDNAKIAQLYGNCGGRTVNSYYFMHGNSHMPQLSVLRTEWDSDPNDFDPFKTYFYDDNEFDTVGVTSLRTTERVLWENGFQIGECGIDKLNILDDSYKRFLELPENNVGNELRPIECGYKVGHDPLKYPNQNELTSITSPIKKKRRKKSNKVLMPNLIDTQKTLIGKGSVELIKDFTIPSMQFKLLKALEIPKDESSKSQVSIQDIVVNQGSGADMKSPKNTSMKQDHRVLNKKKRLAELISNLSKDSSLLTHYYCYQGEQFPTFRKYREHYLFEDVQTLMRVKEQPVAKTVGDDSHKRLLERSDDYIINELGPIECGYKVSHDPLKDPNRNELTSIKSSMKKPRWRNSFDIKKTLSGDGSVELIKDYTTPIMLSSKSQIHIQNTVICKENQERVAAVTSPKNTVMNQDRRVLNKNERLAELIKNLSKDSTLVTHYYYYQGEQYPTFRKYREHYLLKDVQTLMRVKEQPVYTKLKHCSDHTLKIISNSDSNIKIIHEKRNYGDRSILNTVKIDSNYIESPIKHCYYSTDAVEKVLKISSYDLTQITQKSIDIVKISKEQKKTKIKPVGSKDSLILISQQKDRKNETYPLTSENPLTVFANKNDLDSDDRSKIIENLSKDPSLISHYYVYQGENFENFCAFRDVYLFKNLENMYRAVPETVDQDTSFVYSPELEKRKCDSKCSLHHKCIHVMVLFLTFYLIVNFVNCIYIYLFNNFYYLCILFVIIKGIEF